MKLKTELTTCPDCGQTVTCLGGVYGMHYRGVGVVRRQLCSASSMPVVTETWPLAPVDHTAQAWKEHADDGGD